MSDKKIPVEHVVSEDFVEGVFQLLDGREIEARPKPITLLLTTHLPQKWLFVDMEAGQLWDHRYNIASKADIEILRKILKTLDEHSKVKVGGPSLYREISKSVEAVQFTGTNFHECFAFCPLTTVSAGKMFLDAQEVSPHDWLVQIGETFKVMPDTAFNEKYQKQT